VDDPPIVGRPFGSDQIHPNMLDTKKLIRQTQVNNFLGHYAECVRAGAVVYLAAVLEYLAAEVLDWPATATLFVTTRRHGSIRGPHHLQLAVRNDAELKGLRTYCTVFCKNR
jgi:hypothetical protein